VPTNVKWVYFRVAQEALNNIAKHAQAGRVWVTLWHSRGWLTLEVRDDGVGFDPESVPSEGMGLHIMRERAESLGAILRVSAGREGGTRVHLSWRPSADERKVVQ
jgi:signal transduction histidine kinase